ncbi:hypothetical protein ACJX0J_039493, partial [Zea mays]
KIGHDRMENKKMTHMFGLAIDTMFIEMTKIIFGQFSYYDTQSDLSWKLSYCWWLFLINSHTVGNGYIFTSLFLSLHAVPEEWPNRPILKAICAMQMIMFIMASFHYTTC